MSDELGNPGKIGNLLAWGPQRIRGGASSGKVEHALLGEAAPGV
jgi:hypothetical protein